MLLFEDGFINPRFIDGVESFVEFAKSHPECMDGEKLRCPCNHRKCQNKNILDEFTVMTHLENNGFVPNYYRWHHHGESYIPGPSVFGNHQEEALASGETVNSQSHNEFQAMVFNVVGPSFDGNPHGHTQLSVVARLLNLKAEHHFSERLYDELCEFISELMPTDNIMIDSFCSTKNLMRGLGLPVEKIDYCKNGRMFFWREDSELINCKFYPLIQELNESYEEGIQTYDVSSKNNFQMKTAQMWTISDFPAYSMLSCWSTAGKLACPYYMKDSDAFSLPNGRKISWFDNHRKFLPPNHPWRRNKKWFKRGQTVQKIAFTEQLGVQILQEIEDLGLMKVIELGYDAINAKISKNNACG
ncbi:hypothetical protein P3S68_029952 [Capsicum galapagoense]